MHIQKLTIERFKSIESLSLDCRRVNVFIGEPDSGKTNILEALKFLSSLAWNRSHVAHSDVRLGMESGWQTLFFQSFHDRPIRIAMDEVEVHISLPSRSVLDVEVNSTKSAPIRATVPLGQGITSSSGALPFAMLRWYEYGPAVGWTYRDSGSLIVEPPTGLNLLYLIQHHSEVNGLLKEIARELGYRPHFNPATQRLSLSEVRGDDILDYSLEMISDSHKRLFFYSAILATTTDAVLVLDEPDVQAFPPFPKTLGERIADDETNQFFLTTHNPYFLSALVEKTPAKDLAVFVCQRTEKRTTSAVLLSEKQIQQVIEQGADVFFNLEQLVQG